MESTTLRVETGSGFACPDLTARVADWVAEHGDGLCHVFVPHATAGVALMETGAGSESDLQTAVEGLLPRDEGHWVHRHGAPGHGADHLLPVFVSPSLSIPVLGGRMALGTWQSLVLIDSNRDNTTRTVRLSLLPG
jgi:secondary thiamine-phosphate synthase enzyme